MKNKRTPWSKMELKVYTLLLCAKADSVVSEEEMKLIRSKTSAETFDRLYNEIRKDDEETSLKKIEYSVAKLTYSHMELGQLKKEIHEVFRSDNKFLYIEKNLDRILDNIIY